MCTSMMGPRAPPCDAPVPAVIVASGPVLRTHEGRSWKLASPPPARAVRRKSRRLMQPIVGRLRRQTVLKLRIWWRARLSPARRHEAKAGALVGTARIRPDLARRHAELAAEACREVARCLEADGERDREHRAFGAVEQLAGACEPAGHHVA